jgi:hypothetical protein
MKPKSSKQPPAAIKAEEGLKSPTAGVSITEVAPDADQIVKLLKDDPARLPGFVRQSVKHSARLIEAAPLIEKGKRRIEAEKHLGVANLKRSQNAQAERRKYRDIIVRLYGKKPELRRASRERLAREVKAVLARQGITKSTKTIKRALPPKK